MAYAEFEFSAWLIFLGVWVTCWGTIGGFAAKLAKRNIKRGVLLGGTLAIVGVMLAVLVEDDPPPGSTGN